MPDRNGGGEAIPRLSTIKQIAAEAGVGMTTVHRALHGGPHGGAARATVLAAIERLNAEQLARFADWQRSTTVLSGAAVVPGGRTSNYDA